MICDPEEGRGLWSKDLSRRQLLRLSAAAVGGIVLADCGGGDGEEDGERGAASTAPASAPPASGDKIVGASMFDQTGNLSIYGAQMMDMSQYAVDQINAAGGVLGRQIELRKYDTQSKIELYSRYAQEIAANDDVQITVACITSASREAARPVLVRGNKLLFYPVIYEGGVCDKLVFVQGSDPQQQQIPLIDWAFENVGKRVYTIAADYNYGHISEDWTKLLVEKRGGKYLGFEFIPLEVSEFASTIAKIRDAKPEVLMSHLVGANHIAFYRQFAAAGLKDSIKIVSTTFGLGLEEQALEPAEGSGIVVAYAYVDALQNPINDKLKQGFFAAYPAWKVLTDPSVQTWNAWHQWALGVEMAGSLDQAAVIKALETGIEFKGPGGVVKVDPATHHNIQDVALAESNDKQRYTVVKTIAAIPPGPAPPGVAGQCDLIANPDQHVQLVPKGA